MRKRLYNGSYIAMNITYYFWEALRMFYIKPKGLKRIDKAILKNSNIKKILYTFSTRDTQNE